MSAIWIFAAITGLQPFCINRVSFTLAFTIAALVIAKLVNAFLFCGFNGNVFIDLPFGVVLFAGYCIVPLLGLAVSRRTKTKQGYCCRIFAIVVISTWFSITCVGTCIFFEVAALLGGLDHSEDGVYRGFKREDRELAVWDPLSVCGNQTRRNVRAQFSKAMPTYNVLQRIDLVYKILAGLGWLFPIVFAGVSLGFFMRELLQGQKEKEDHPLIEDSEAGSPDDNDETIIWMEAEEGRSEEFSAAAELKTIRQVSDQPATIDIDCESPMFDGVEDAGQSKTDRSLDARKAKDVISCSDSCDNNAKP